MFSYQAPWGATPKHTFPCTGGPTTLVHDALLVQGGF